MFNDHVWLMSVFYFKPWSGTLNYLKFFSSIFSGESFHLIIIRNFSRTTYQLLTTLIDVITETADIVDREKKCINTIFSMLYNISTCFVLFENAIVFVWCSILSLSMQLFMLLWFSFIYILFILHYNTSARKFHTLIFRHLTAIFD